jgi:hypothetical protein
MPTQTQLAKKQRSEIIAADSNNLDALARAYANMYDGLQGDVDALVLVIQDLDNPTRAEIERLPQYKRLVRNAERELDDFNTYLKTAIGAAGIAAIGLGLSHSASLVSNLTGNAYTGLTPNVMRPLLDYLKKGSPLYQRLDMITTSTIDKVIEAIVSGVGSGFNPQKIADLIQGAFGGGLTDALRNMRTVQLYSYRDSARANYMASGVVDGWVWWAELDDVCCMSCVAQHGTVHPLDEQLDDHYNGRCAALPYIEGLSPTEQTGKDWFDSLTPEQQAAQMGKSKHEAYTAGKFEFSALSKQFDNDVYGKMRSEASLKDLLGE